MLDLEELEENEIEHIRMNYRKLASEARKSIEQGLNDTDFDEVSDVEWTTRKRRSPFGCLLRKNATDLARRTAKSLFWSIFRPRADELTARR